MTFHSQKLGPQNKQLSKLTVSCTHISRKTQTCLLLKAQFVNTHKMKGQKSKNSPPYHSLCFLIDAYRRKTRERTFETKVRIALTKPELLIKSSCALARFHRLKTLFTLKNKIRGFLKYAQLLSTRNAITFATTASMQKSTKSITISKISGNPVPNYEF